MAAPKVDILVNLLLQLQPNPATTTLPLNDADQPLDYSRLIGGMVVDHDTRLSQLTSSLNTLYGYTTILQNQMATIIANGLVVPQIQLNVIMGDYAYYNVEVVVSAIGSQLDTLRTATGTSTTLGQAVSYQDKIYSDTSEFLKTQVSLSDTTKIMLALSGWVTTPATAADAIKNMWITINDMRKAVQTFINTSEISCGTVSVAFRVYIDVITNKITLFFLGNSTIPEGFIDQDSTGSLLTITDSASSPNTYSTYVNISQANKNPNGVIIDLNGTPINLYTNISLSLPYILTNGSLSCPGTRTYTSLPTPANPCTSLVLTPFAAGSYTGIFTAIPGKNITYIIKTCSDAACTTVLDTKTISSFSETQLSITVTGITAGTRYVKMYTQVAGATQYTCPTTQIITIT